MYTSVTLCFLLKTTLTGLRACWDGRSEKHVAFALAGKGQRQLGTKLYIIHSQNFHCPGEKSGHWSPKLKGKIFRFYYI